MHNMPSSSSSYVLVVCLLLPALAISTTAVRHHNNDNHHHHDNGLKSMHFTLYQHDTLNKTSFLIVEGVAGPSISSFVSPLGSIFIARDPLTASPEPSSEVRGNIEGASITSSFDGLDNISLAKINLNLKGHKGSVSALGSINIEPSTVPVVGGTGDFLLVQGYMVVSLIDVTGSSLIYKIEFHLFWPPYAAQALSC